MKYVITITYNITSKKKKIYTKIYTYTLYNKSYNKNYIKLLITLIKPNHYIFKFYKNHSRKQEKQYPHNKILNYTRSSNTTCKILSQPTLLEEI